MNYYATIPGNPNQVVKLVALYQAVSGYGGNEGKYPPPPPHPFSQLYSIQMGTDDIHVCLDFSYFLHGSWQEVIGFIE
jgi:hypothetical protein